MSGLTLVISYVLLWFHLLPTWSLQRNKTKYLLFWKCSVLLLWSVRSTVLIFLMYYPRPFLLICCYQVFFSPLICYFLSRYQGLNPWYFTSFSPTGSYFFVLVPDLDLVYAVPSLLAPLLTLCDHILIPGFHLMHLLPPVLVPGLDLGVAELQWGGQLHTVLNAQVLLLLEAPLQPRQLLVAECRPSFAGFL